MAKQQSQSKSHSPRSRSLRVQDSVLQNKHLDLREKLNFRSIFPYLNSHGLLPASYDQTKLVNEKATVQQQIDDIITHLPKCGKEDYLREFIECLRASEEGTGSAHLELAKSLEDAYTAKMKDLDLQEHQRECNHEESTENSANQAFEQLMVQYHDVSVTSTTVEHPCEDGTQKSRHHRKLYRGCMCGLLLTLLVALLMVITTFGVLSGVPTINQDLSTVRPLFAYGSAALVVDFGTDPFWIARADFQVEDCNGAVLTTEGKKCLDLPVSISQTSDSSFISYLYSLPGSTINITVMDTAANTGLEVWQLNSEAWLKSDLGVNRGSCDDPPSGSKCFFAQGFAEQTVQEVIEKADYYFFYTNPPLNKAIRFSYTARQYNLTAIRQLHSPAETTITQDLSHTVVISNAFDFRQRKCVLLDLSCLGSQHYPIHISGVKRRMDVLIIPGVIGIFIALALISVISVCVIRIVWPKLTN